MSFSRRGSPSRRSYDQHLSRGVFLDHGRAGDQYAYTDLGGRGYESSGYDARPDERHYFPQHQSHYSQPPPTYAHSSGSSYSLRRSNFLAQDDYNAVTRIFNSLMAKHFQPSTFNAGQPPSAPRPQPPPPPPRHAPRSSDVGTELVPIDKFTNALADLERAKEQLVELQNEKRERAAKAKDKRLRKSAKKKESSSENPGPSSSSETAQPVAKQHKPAAGRSPYKAALDSICLPDQDLLARVVSAESKGALRDALRAARPGPVENIRDVWIACFGRSRDMPSTKEVALTTLADFLQAHISQLAAK